METEQFQSFDLLREVDTGKGSHNPDAPGVEEMLRGAFVIEDQGEKCLLPAENLLKLIS